MTSTPADQYDILEFFLATDGLKRIQRRNTLVDDSRFETVAEHTWHLSLLELLLEPFAPPNLNPIRVRDLITVHDLVEVFAGDIWFYTSATDVTDRESSSAKELLDMLPKRARTKMAALIEEFQSQSTLEARYVRALDVLHPMIISYAPGGSESTDSSLNATTVLSRKRPHLERFPVLWQFACELVSSGVERGVLDSP